LAKVTFEPGSHLKEIKSEAFAGCHMTEELFIPASVERMTGASLPPSASCRIAIESGNRYFEEKEGFVMALNHHCLVRFLGKRGIVSIPDDIEEIDECCFQFCDVFSLVLFGSTSKLSSIGRLAFHFCSSLKTIKIPSSVTFLGPYCFSGCCSLATVSFCDGEHSSLKCISDHAFVLCAALESIVLPSSVKIIEAGCFFGCRKLVVSPLPVDSEVVRIERIAFSGCGSLRSMILPPSVAFVGEFCFRECSALSSLTFASPSHLRELLDLPPQLPVFLSIPDSVEILSFQSAPPPLHDRTLIFGPDSRLTEIRAKRSPRSSRWRSFVQFSSRSLKAFRIDLEFRPTVCEPESIG
jgi:hypothetical protein